MNRWLDALNSNPIPWLLEPDDPAVRQAALRLLLDRTTDDPDVIEAQQMAMRVAPIATILANQHPDGYWVKPGPGYSPKYTSTVWSVIFLDQLGADGNDPRIRRACEYILEHTQAENGGFGASGQGKGKAPSSTVVHCLNGNLLRALIGFGWIGDPRVSRAIEWQARSITGDDFDGYYRSGTAGPGFACAANEGIACAWGAIKALRALARIPSSCREPYVVRAIEKGIEFLLSRDPSIADYPSSSRISGNWFKLGFPSGYVADSLQVLETLAELGQMKDPCLANAIDWILSLQDDRGRWRNRYAYNRKMWVDIEKQGALSKWVTLRACYVLKHAVT